MSVATFIKDKSLVYIFHTFEKITFKSFLININSLGHERRKTIHTLDFHRKLIWTSLSTNILFIRKYENLRNEGTSLFGFPEDILLAGVTYFVFETGSHVAWAADPSASTFQVLGLHPCTPMLAFCHSRKGFVHARWYSANWACVPSQPQYHFYKWLRLPWHGSFQPEPQRDMKLNWP